MYDGASGRPTNAEGAVAFDRYVAMQPQLLATDPECVGG
jgi:hypothetical protein